MAVLLAILLPSALMPASLIPAWYERRLHPDSVQVRDVKGVSDRIVGGEAEPDAASAFWACVLMNSTDINLTRLDVYTANNQIEAMKAPYDPSLGHRFQYAASRSRLPPRRLAALPR